MIRFLPELGNYQRIIVTGPHRAGTTIGAKILSHELGYDFKIEAEVEKTLGWNLENFKAWLLGQEKIVVQGASAFRFVPDALSWPHTAVVCMHRPLKEIINSRMKAGLTNMMHPDRVYEVWGTVGAPAVNAFDLRYSDLEYHQLFHGDRKGWKPRQIAPGESEVTD